MELHNTDPYTKAVYEADFRTRYNYHRANGVEPITATYMAGEEAEASAERYRLTGERVY